MWNWRRTREDGGKGKNTVTYCDYLRLLLLLNLPSIFACRTRWMVQERSMLARPLDVLFAIACQECLGHLAMNSQTEEAMVSGSGSVAVASCTGAFAAGGGA